MIRKSGEAEQSRVQRPGKRTSLVVIASMVLSYGCGPVVQTSLGTQKRTISTQVLSSKPRDKELMVSFRMEGDSLALKATWVQMCDVQVQETYETVERVRRVSKVPPSKWLTYVLSGVGLLVIGGYAFVDAPNQPTTGITSEGEPYNPRESYYLASGICITMGALSIGLFTPLTGEKEIVTGKGARPPKTVVKPCGEEPYLEPIELASGMRSVRLTPDKKGVARFSRSDFGSHVNPSNLVVVTPRGHLLAVELTQAEIETWK